MRLPDKAVTLGFDIGGTWVRGARFDRGRAVRRLKFRTPATAAGLERRLVRSIASLAGRARLERAGFGVAGAVAGTLVTGSANTPALRGFDFARLSLSCPIAVMNDARAWLAGALQARNLRSTRVLCLTLGTGVGRAYALNGRVRRLAPFESSEAWEGEYQRLRRRPELARYLAWQLRGLLNRYRPSVLLVGGGVADKRRGLVDELASELHGAYPKLAVRRVPGSEWLGCLGAAGSGLRQAS